VNFNLHFKRTFLVTFNEEKSPNKYAILESMNCDELNPKIKLYYKIDLESEIEEFKIVIFY